MMNKHFFLNAKYLTADNLAILFDILDRHKITYKIEPPDEDNMCLIKYEAEDWQVNVVMSSLIYDVFSLTQKINKNGIN